MLKISFILASLILLSLQIIFLVLFIKHINLMEKFSETQLLLHEELLQIRIDLIKIKGKAVLQEFHKNRVHKKPVQNNPTLDLKSSPVSEKELAKLLQGKDLAFKKQVDVSSGEMFINTDIQI